MVDFDIRIGKIELFFIKRLRNSKYFLSLITLFLLAKETGLAVVNRTAVIVQNVFIHSALELNHGKT